MLQSVGTFPPGTWPLVLKNLLSFRIPKIPPPAAPESSVSHHKPRNPSSRRYKQSPQARGNRRSKHSGILRASSRVQHQIAASQPQNRGVGEGPTNWESCSALAWFPSENKSRRAHGKITQAQVKCWTGGGGDRTRRLQKTSESFLQYCETWWWTWQC